MNIADDYAIRHHGNIINDRVRTSANVEALRHAIHSGSVVLDIGTGTGIFALMACKCEAARVYVIEAEDVIEVARRCATNIAGAERVTWLQGFSSDIELPKGWTSIVGDLHDVLPLYNRNIAALIDSRRRYLTIPRNTERSYCESSPLQAARR